MDARIEFTIGPNAAAALMLDDHRALQDRGVEWLAKKSGRLFTFRCSRAAALELIKELEDRGHYSSRGEGWDTTPGEAAACRRAAVRMKKRLAEVGR